MKLVEVIWDDPWSPTDPWVSLKDIRNFDHEPHKTVGYLLKPKDHRRGKNWIVVAGSINGADGTYGGVTVIHKALIVRMRTLKGVKDGHDKGVDLNKD